MDCYALVHDVLGHEQCAVAGGDVGGVVLWDIGLRYPGFVTKQIFFNTVPPPLNDDYAAAGIPPDDVRDRRAQADYFVRQGNDPDGLLAELDSPDHRQRYIAGMYSHRLWGTSNAFDADDVQFHTEPYRDADKLRASWGVYEQVTGNRPMEDVPCLFQKTPIPTLVLYGPEDHVVMPSFPWKAQVACLDCTGPLFIPKAGHFLQWEQADTFNRLTALLPLLDSARDLEHHRLAQRGRQHLHADRQTTRGAERHRHRGLAGEVHGNRAHVAQVHGERIRCLGADLERNCR